MITKCNKPKAILPSCDELNDLFINKQIDDKENELDFEFNYFLNDTKYSYSKDAVKMSFIEESEFLEDFPILSINVRSIVNRDHFTQFEALLENLSVKPMIIALSETWITDLSQGPYSNIPGYQFIQNNRKNVNGGGGVCFYIADHLHFTKIDSLTIMKEKVFESLFISVDVNGSSIVCGNVYRSSSEYNHVSFFETLNSVLTDCSKMNKKIILMGDLNYNLLDTEENNVTTCVDMFFEFGFYPLINIPTRITDTTASVLDHFWTNIIDMPVNSTVINDPIADHLPIFMNVGVSISKENLIVEKRNFSQRNIENFISALRQMYIADILQQRSTNAAYDTFIKRYKEIFEKSFPMKKVKTKSKETKFKRPWYTKELHIMNDEKEKSYNLYIQNKNSVFLKWKYNNSRNLYFRNVKKAKQKFYQDHLIKVRNNIKGTWNVINSVLGRKKGKQLFKLSINGKEIKNKAKIATEFNSYFSKVAKNLVKQIPSCQWRKRFDKYLGEKNKKSFRFERTTPMEILKILRSLPAKSSSGWDNVPQKIR